MNTWLGPVVALCLVPWAAAQNYGSCDYYQTMQPNTSYYVYNPNYPNKYSPGSACRWYAVCPDNYQVLLVCQTFDVPASASCVYDKLAVSKSGSVDMSDAENYCGQGSFNAVSNSNRMTVVLNTVANSPGGSFLCSIGCQPQGPGQGACDCGMYNKKRIVGGTEVGINEYPMVAGLIDGYLRELFCGCTIISPTWVVTAAHCLIKKSPSDLGVLVGDHDITVGSDTDHAKLYPVDRLVSHPQYNTVNQANDIALVRVNQAMQYNMAVGPACLPFSNTRDSFAGESVDALGWGTTDFGGQMSNTLQKVSLGVLTISQCQNHYGNMVTDNQICTYRENKDACQSDSGGPILWKDPMNGRLKLVGVISYGRQCATTTPSVNTRVSRYLTWIAQVTDDEFCVK